MNIDLENKELFNIFRLFFDKLPHQYEIKNTKISDTDTGNLAEMDGQP